MSEAERRDPVLRPPEAGPAPEMTAGSCARCGAALEPDQEWCLECGASRTVIRSPRGWRAPLILVGGVFAAALIALAVALVGLSSDANRIAATKIAAATPTVTVTTPALTPATPPVTTATTAVTPPPTATSTASPPATAVAPAATATATPAPSPSTATTSPAATTTPHAASKTRSATASDSSSHVAFATWPPGLGGWTVVLYVSSSRSAALARAHQLADRLTGIGVLVSDDHPLLTPGFYVVFAGHYAGQVKAQAAAHRLQGQGFTYAHARQIEPPGGD